jgi:hypothetical protein
MTAAVRRVLEGLLTVLLLGAWAWVAVTASDATQRNAAAPAAVSAPVLAWQAVTEGVEHAAAGVAGHEHNAVVVEQP